MAHSIIEYTGDGSTTQYALNFTLGILSRDYVTCRVDNEVDGLDNPAYRDLTWITDGLVEIQGTAPALDAPIVFTRTIPKDELVHDYSNGSPIEESNLDQSNLQNIMLAQEFLDGRISSLGADFDLGGNRIVNLADPVNAQDAATKYYIDNFEALNTTVILASVAKAEQWAEEDEDVEVETGQYSAKHHALKAEAAAAVLPLNNYTATSDPTVDDDSGDGYTVGSQWFNTSTGDRFQCTSAAVGAAVWVAVSALAPEDLGTMAFEAATDYYLKSEIADIRQIPQLSKSADYTFVLADGGKHVLHPSADTTARTFTIPANASVAFPIGTAITFVNQDSAGDVSIAITTDTMRLAGDGTTGTRTLTENGVATALKITSTEWIISGTNLT